MYPWCSGRVRRGVGPESEAPGGARTPPVARHPLRDVRDCPHPAPVNRSRPAPPPGTLAGLPASRTVVPAAPEGSCRQPGERRRPDGNRPTTVRTIDPRADRTPPKGETRSAVLR
ncbi:hypothetical protein JCM13580A_29110 [Streptomyces drozdowiczii]